MITLFILSLLVVTIATLWLLSRRRRLNAQLRPDDIPLFAVPATSATNIARPSYSGWDVRPRTPAPLAGPPAEKPDASTAAHPGYAVAAPTIRTREGEVSTLPRPGRVPIDTGDTPGPAELGEAMEGASVRYWRPADGTLQFLPGRLEVVSGRDAGQEIRFVRTAGPDGTSVTFGRAEGAPYRHVQLREPTVSRAHAKMFFESQGTPNGSGERGTTQAAHGPASMRWRLQNLSATNPVVVNGRPLDAEGGPRASVILSDGDRIEMGEVAFVFRAR